MVSKAAAVVAEVTRALADAVDLREREDRKAMKTGSKAPGEGSIETREDSLIPKVRAFLRREIVPAVVVVVDEVRPKHLDRIIIPIIVTKRDRLLPLRTATLQTTMTIGEGNASRVVDRGVRLIVIDPSLNTAARLVPDLARIPTRMTLDRLARVLMATDAPTVHIHLLPVLIIAAPAAPDADESAAEEDLDRKVRTKATTADLDPRPGIRGRVREEEVVILRTLLPIILRRGRELELVLVPVLRHLPTIGIPATASPVAGDRLEHVLLRRDTPAIVIASGNLALTLCRAALIRSAEKG